MKTKTINAVISKKINEWLESIKDKSLRKEVKNKIIVTGGCITSMLLNEDVNDFDIYFTDKDIVKKISQYYCKQFNKRNRGRKNKLNETGEAWVLDGTDIQKWKDGKINLTDFTVGYEYNLPYSLDMEWNDRNPKTRTISGMLLNTPEDRIKIIINSDGVAKDSDEVADTVDYSVESYVENINDADDIDISVIDKDKKKYRPIFLSSNAITLSDKIQIVIRFYGNPEEIHNNYDFVHTTNYWTFETGVVLNQRALEAILNKELFYVGSKYPIASLVRTRKFIKRGWQINAGQYLKMAWQISKLDLNDIYVLEDQCTGVDSIYFLQFIDNIKRKKQDDREFTLNQDYLISVIDRIF